MGWSAVAKNSTVMKSNLTLHLRERGAQSVYHTSSNVRLGKLESHQGAGGKTGKHTEELREKC